ncbi:MAG: CoA pyrophosphatase [Coriobacteriales bacterium]|nr:CoA pyrophosphatase [Coriobacteriales bacterium]
MDVLQVQNALAATPQSKGAAVVIPLVPGEDGLAVLLEVRAMTLDVQPGEVCLPGGRIEEGEEPLDAAIRETCEELLVEPHQLEVLAPMGRLEGPGGLPLYVFVATLSGYEGTFSPEEVDRTFCVSLDWLMQHEPTAYRVAYEPRYPNDFPWELVPGGRAYAWRTRPHEVLFYEETDPVIWGVTARVLERFSAMLARG